MKTKKTNIPAPKFVDPRIKELEKKLGIFEEREKQLIQRIRIDEFISTNKQQTLFAQLRAVEARCHLAYTIMDLTKEENLYEENKIYAEGYLNLIRSKIVI